MATAKQYRIQDFEAIIFNGLEYTLPAEVLHNIMDLQQKLGYQKVDRPQHNKKMPPSSSWKPPPPKEEFKATIIVQERIGIEKDISNLRVSLNKISGKNFDSQCEIIIKIIEPYLNDEESLARIVQTIFDISGSNSFLSELNAKLYLKLTEKSVYFLERIQDLIASGTTVIFVSHDMALVREICSRVAWLDHGSLRMVGETAAVLDSYENQ